MNDDLVPYKPGHPKAPMFKRRLKGVKVNKHTKKAEAKVKYSSMMHNRFRAANKDCKFKDSELTEILQAFNENMVEASLTNRAGVTLPNRMGRLQVMMYPKGKKLHIDRLNSEKLGYEVHHSRLTNAGKFPLATVEVFDSTVNMVNKDLWEFKAHPWYRVAQREVLKIDRKRFMDAKRGLVIHYRKEKFYKKEFAIKRQAEVLETYNEFEGII